jgi:lipopolysaccharide biosynthesis glycosyltransferase
MASAKAAPDPSSDRRIRVLFCCNPAFYQHLAVALVSMLENNPHAQFDAHLISSSHDERLEEKLRRSLAAYRNVVLTIHYLSLDSYAHFFVRGHVTVESYLRIFAAEVLEKEIGKILYLDCDLVVLGNLWDLWNTDIDTYALAAVPDGFVGSRGEALGIPTDRPYVNAGVMLMNLRRWRADRLAQRLIRFIEAQGSSLRYWDQDAINAVLHDSILPLDHRWNLQAMTYKSRWRQYRASDSGLREACRRPAILHYSTAEKPWRFRAIVKKKLFYFDYLAKTDWRSANPLGLAWYHRPEFYLDHLLSRLGVDYTLIVRVVRKFRRLVVQGRAVTKGPVGF